MAINKRIIRSNDEAAAGGDFNTAIWDGGTPQSIDVGFEPDLIWIKSRGVANNHNLADSVRGIDNILFSNLTNADATRLNSIETTSTGFNLLDTWAGRNDASYGGYVGWCWKAGGAAVTNTDGTITSQVSANTEAGFSIVNYTGNDVSGNSSVGHGLGITPKIVIQKNRSISSNWEVQTTIIDGSNDFLYLNDTRAAGNASQLPPESDVFWIRKDIYVNQNNSSNQYINYCFAEVAGFSKFGSYSGNGPTGQTIVTGFEPAFVMLKRTNGVSNWAIADNKRTDGELLANVSDAERIENTPDFISNGFTFTTERYNDIGEEWIYMAFANQF